MGLVATPARTSSSFPGSAARFGVLFAGATLAICLAVGLIVPPALYNDVAAGWQVWTAMQAGAPFNSIWTAAHDNLAVDVPMFVAGWSPGHYLVPALFTLLGLSFGHALTVAGVLANALGLAGYWKLWRAWGIPLGAVAASVLVAASGRTFLEVVGTANLGDTLLFAVVPWTALLAQRWRALGWRQCAGLLLVFNLAVVVKLSYEVAALATLAGLVSQAGWEHRGPDRRTDLIWPAAKCALLFLAVYGFWELGYVRFGPGVAPEHSPSFPGLARLAMPWGGPLLAAFSAGGFLIRAFVFPGHQLLSGVTSLWLFYLLSALLTLAVVVHLWRASDVPRIYVVQLTTWLAVYGAVFGTLYATGATVSLEDRHYYVPGLMLLPGVLWSISTFRHSVSRWAATAIVAVFCVYGLGSLILHARDRHLHGVESRHGFLHMELTRGALAELRRLDDEPGLRTLFFVTKTEIALEVRRGRAVCITLDTLSEPVVRSFTYEGRADRVVIIVPDRFVENGQADWITSGLHGYQTWNERRVDGFTFLTGQ